MTRTTSWLLIISGGVAGLAAVLCAGCARPMLDARGRAALETTGARPIMTGPGRLLHAPGTGRALMTREERQGVAAVQQAEFGGKSS